MTILNNKHLASSPCKQYNPAPMFAKRFGPRAEFQAEQGKRVKESPSMAVNFPTLKVLDVILIYQDAKGSKKGNTLKYSVNLTNAKSVFRFKCPNTECIGGDFDLTNELEFAVSKRRTSLNGEMACKGRTITRCDCDNILRYTLTLGY
jgi:hypothetical protein